MNHTRSSQLFQQAKASIPGGVNSPVRAFKSVGADPLFIKRAAGCHIVDEDDNSFVDYVGSWGPMIVGHNHPAVRAAVEQAIGNGLSFGAPCAAEVTMAETITRLVDYPLIPAQYPLSFYASQSLKKRQLVPIAGIYELALGRISPEDAQALEQAIGTGEVWGIGLAQDDQLLGAATIVLPAGQHLALPHIIETFAYQVTIWLRRQQIERDLRGTLLRIELRQACVQRGYLLIRILQRLQQRRHARIGCGIGRCRTAHFERSQLQAQAIDCGPQIAAAHCGEQRNQQQRQP